MKKPTRRPFIAWGIRLLLGVALGWGFRMVYERRPVVRFATGMAVRSVTDSAGDAAERGPHVRGGRPYFFSLDQIMAAPDPAAALRAWREALESAPEDVQRNALKARAEVSIGALRGLLVRLPASAALREEMNALLAFARDRGADLYDPDATLRSLMELARLDPGLALDGAEALNHDEATRMIWAVIAEDTPERVIELVKSGQAPPEALQMALATLAATDLEKASALMLTLPDDAQEDVTKIVTDVLARTRPLEALALQPGADGKPDQSWAELIIRRVPGPQALDFLLGLERQYPELLKACPNEISELLQRQAARDPGFVFEWMERRDVQPGGLTQDQGQTLTAVAGDDPARAAALVQRWPGDRVSRRVQSAIANAWMSRDPIAALEWVRTQPDASLWLREGTWAEAVAPEQAPVVARWLADNGISDATPGYEATKALVKPWVQHDPAAAVAWVNSQPAGPNRVSTAAVAAYSLVDQLPGRLASRFIGSLIEGSPEALGAVVARVSSDNLSLGESVTKALPQLMAEASSNRSLTTDRIARHLASSLQNPATRQGVLDAITSLPAASQRQLLLDEVASDPRQNLTLRLARDLAAAMPDQVAARTLMERAVSRRLNR